MAKFRHVFNTIMKQTHADDQEIFDIIMKYLEEKPAGEAAATADPNKGVNFERLNILIEAFQFYPLIIKRDKNLSSSIHQVLNSNNRSDNQVNFHIFNNLIIV